jgi:ATP-dependent DNA helicase RecQ
LNGRVHRDGSIRDLRQTERVAPTDVDAHGRDIPDAETDQPLCILKTVFGLPGFRGEQQPIIEHITDGGDAIVLMPTGGGKSLCYQIPDICRLGVGIVVSPLIALMRNQVDILRPNSACVSRR